MEGFSVRKFPGNFSHRSVQKLLPGTGFMLISLQSALIINRLLIYSEEN